MPRKYNKKTVATLRKNVRAKGKGLGSDGIVSYNAAQSKYRRALQKGVDPNGNPVPAGLKGEQKVKWAKGVENAKRAKKASAKATGKTKAKLGAMRKTESRRKKNVKELKDLYIQKAENASAANKNLVSKLKQRVAADPNDVRSRNLLNKYTARQKSLDTDLALKKKALNGFDGFDNAEAVQAKKILRSDFDRKATPSSLKADANAIMQIKKDEAFANSLKQVYKGKVRDIDPQVFRKLGMKVAIQRTEMKRLTDVNFMLKNNYYPKNRFDMEQFPSYIPGGATRQKSTYKPFVKKGIIAGPKPLPRNQKQALDQKSILTSKIPKRAKEIDGLVKNIQSAPYVAKAATTRRVTSGTSGKRQEISFSDYFSSREAESRFHNSYADPSSWSAVLD